jgi:hypothetical protein
MIKAMAMASRFSEQKICQLPQRQSPKNPGLLCAFAPLRETEFESPGDGGSDFTTKDHHHPQTQPQKSLVFFAPLRLCVNPF